MKFVATSSSLSRWPDVRTCSLVLLFSVTATSAIAQVRRPAHSSGFPPAQAVLPASGPSNGPAGKPSAIVGSPTATMPVASAPSQATSLLEQPPKQANIDAAPNRLTIRADNSSLTQTLQRVADKTGMHLEGISGDQRVFGTFGPGETRDVLNTLLTGTGYNIVMIGALDNGAPRQLILSQKKSSASAAAVTNPTPVDQDQTTLNTPQDDDVTDSQPDDQPIPPQMVPPQRGGDPTGGNGGVRTPQQLLQQMQQMRQQTDSQGNPQP